MMMTTTTLNDLATAIVADKSHADKLISILYKKKKMSVRGKMKIELLTYVLVRSIYLDRMCVSKGK
jgi:hypothetical protein